MNFMGNRPSNIRVILQKFYVNKPTLISSLDIEFLTSRRLEFCFLNHYYIRIFYLDTSLTYINLLHSNRFEIL